jgi:hypothetical protein
MACDDTRGIETLIRRRERNDMEEERKRLCPHEQNPAIQSAQSPEFAADGKPEPDSNV